VIAPENNIHDKRGFDMNRINDINICDYNDVSGITSEEYFSYYCKDENAKIAYENIFKDNSELEKELEDTRKKVEIIHEQLFFATELLDSIEYHLNKETRMSEFKKTFRRLLEDSMLER
jgi:hypothetical protein